jgi:glycoside hydrolase-like protein
MAMTFPATVDYSYARPGAQAIKDYGANGAMRYLGTDGRCITTGERDELLGAGLGIGLIWETTARRPADSGWTGGVADAQSANREADRLAAPGDCPIFYAVDFQPTSAELGGPIADYFRGALSVGGRPVRAYGCAAVLQHLCGDCGMFPDSWQCGAWSYAGTAPGTPINDGGYSLVLSPYASSYQAIGYVMGDQCDHNNQLVTSPYWLWGVGSGAGDEMTDEDWNRMASLLNTMIVGKLAEHSSPQALVGDDNCQFTVVLGPDGPRRYTMGSPPEVTLLKRLGLIAPSHPEAPPKACPPVIEVSTLSPDEREVLYGYPEVSDAS